VAGPFRRHHQHVDIGARLDEVEMHVEPMGEHQGGTVLHVAGEMIAIDVGLDLVGREHHDHIGPFRGLRDLHHGKLLALRLLGRARALPKGDRDVLHARIAKIERMRMALAAIADDGDLLALDEIDVGIPVIINTHEHSLLKPAAPRRSARSRGRIRWGGS
jgi:hypothetical protein